MTLAVVAGACMHPYFLRWALAASKTTVCEQGCQYTSLQEAVQKAKPGSEISISSPQTIRDETIRIEKPLHIQTNNNAEIRISGGQTAFIVTPSGLGTAIRGFTFIKTDAAKQQQLISINADNVEVSGNRFRAVSALATAALERVISAGYVTGLSVDDNDFEYSTRPVYIGGEPLPSPTLSEVYVDSSVIQDGDGTAGTPLRTIQEGLDRVSDGGIVHVRNGSYHETLRFKRGTVKLIGQSRDGVQVTLVADSSGNGLLVQQLKNITIENLTFNAPAQNGVAALKMSQSRNIVLRNLKVNGRGHASLPPMNGVDLNTVDGATLEAIEVDNFSKSGIAVTSQYAQTFEVTRSLILANITSTRNHRAGIAFYTVGDDKSLESPPSTGPKQHITGIQFRGQTTVTGNAVGIQVSGEDDQHVHNRLVPTYTVAGPDQASLTILRLAAAGNNIDVMNYQPAGLTIFEAADQNITIFDKRTMPSLGQVRLGRNPAQKSVAAKPLSAVVSEALQTPPPFSFFQKYQTGWLLHEQRGGRI